MTRLDPTGKELSMHRIRSGSEREQRERWGRGRVPSPWLDLLVEVAMVEGDNDGSGMLAAMTELPISTTLDLDR
jgi:hypothetical protein